ncbi:DNA repair protein RecN (Recombination protein N) [Monaibacterium marinum]|uniref:DNA repair protein RecN n=1 Tax=Pontivivens marinum TaxID=1690039 RepID=A0A2C9CRN4_9RHOB|nr:DNA repair protein RecN [Monaibacterium marinum]SOH94014.1 DNA repair protein RecN (Recombination protein N) [Monaibacterium marinum]
MLLSLGVRDIILIDQLDLAFRPGLNVLTGETGAGKSILLDALGFALGHRGRADLVRSGADLGEVVAEFDVRGNKVVANVLIEAGLPADEDSLLIRRTNTRDGRKTAWVNDRRCSGEVLRRLSSALVEIHGQHDDRGLLDPKGHRDLVDDYADSAPLLEETRNCWTTLAKAQRALRDARIKLEEARQDEEFLRHAIIELDALDPQRGEDAELDITRRQMQAAGRLREDIARADAAIGPQGAEGPLNDALRWVEGAAAALDGLADPSVAALERILAELSDAQSGIGGLLDSLDFDPLELERIEERLFAIRGLARKHGVLADDLARFAQEMRTRLADIDSGADQIADLEDALKSAQRAYDAAARALHTHRVAAAQRLDRAMAAELSPLKMERAVFATEITDGPATAEGTDIVMFTVATNPGAPSGPINKIASGGELSRFLLALKVCLTTRADSLTMIFDEIDRGVGGATADAVGRRLSSIADKAQVLVVTHSPQVAARGGHHWRIAKSVTNGVTTTDVTPLDMDDRVDEIARMLSGDRVTDEARAAARTLLND